MTQFSRRTGGASGLTYQVRRPDEDPSLSVIMLHGLGGNEQSMWVLESALPENAFIISPRGLYPVGVESYSWVAPSIQGWPKTEDFLPSVRGIERMLGELKEDRSFDRHHLVLMGFSQGAALSFAAVSALAPSAVIAAAGFIPGGSLAGLNGLPIFWGHGIDDEWISITRAREEAERLSALGAQVEFCETEVGHKLGLECLQGLRKWLRRQMVIG